jgi:tetratricopeptide (TPR) repeat protein
MKKLIIAVAMVVTAQAMAQKEIKPSLPKAEKALVENKLDEAKAIIDVTVASQDFMLDKKGGPSKSAAKAWYLKGLIYAAIDTTKKEQFKSLEANPFAVAKEAFDKSAEIDKGKTSSFVNDPASGFPLLPSQVNGFMAQAYFNKAIAAYQNDKDYKKAFMHTEQTLYFLPGDTSILMNAGVFFAPAAQEYDKSIQYINEYIQKGGKSQDAYIILFDNYFSKKKDNAKALEVLKVAKEKFPANSDFAKYELNIYLTDKKYDVAKELVEKQVKENPTDKESYYLLGQLQDELKQNDLALASYNKALEIDPKYFDAAIKIAAYYWNDAKKVKDEMGKLGTSKADMAKMQELDKQYVEKLKVYLPYLEKCEKLSPDDLTVLYSLLNAYTDLDVQPSIARVKKKLKSLGEEVD